MARKSQSSSPPSQLEIEHRRMKTDLDMAELRAMGAYISWKVAQLVQTRSLHTHTKIPHRSPPSHEHASLEQSTMRLRLWVAREKLRSAKRKWDNRYHSSEFEDKEKKGVEKGVKEAKCEDVIVLDRVEHTHGNVQEKAQEQDSVAIGEEVLEKVDEDHVLVLPRALQDQVANEDDSQRLRADLSNVNESEDESIQGVNFEEEVEGKSEKIVEEIDIGEMVVPMEMHHTKLDARQEVMKLCAMKSKNFEFDAHVLHDGYWFKGSETCEFKESILELNMRLRDRALKSLMGQQEDEYVDAILVYNTFEEIDDLNLRANSSQPGEDDPFVTTLAHEIKAMRPP